MASMFEAEKMHNCRWETTRTHTGINSLTLAEDRASARRCQPGPLARAMSTAIRLKAVRPGFSPPPPAALLNVSIHSSATTKCYLQLEQQFGCSRIGMTYMEFLVLFPALFELNEIMLDPYV